jgi:hypothetical protein
MAKRTKKQTMGIVLVLGILVIAVGVLAHLNRGDLDRHRSSLRR